YRPLLLLAFFDFPIAPMGLRTIPGLYGVPAATNSAATRVLPDLVDADKSYREAASKQPINLSIGVPPSSIKHRVPILLLTVRWRSRLHMPAISAIKEISRLGG